MRGRHPNSLRNLRPLQPGQTANPKGINRKRPYTDRLHEVAEKTLPEEMRLKINSAFEKQFGAKNVMPAGTTYADAEVLRLHLNVIMKGDTSAATFIADRIEGRPPNRLDLIGHERQEITIKLVEDPPLPLASGDRVEANLFRDIVALIERSNDDEDEGFLTKAAEFARLIKVRAERKVVDVTPTR